jgi:hypothetical protein
MRRWYPHPRKCYASMHLSLEWAHPWGVATAACLDIAEIHMAILDPAGPPIGVDAGVFQDQRPCMRGGRRAIYLHSSRFIIVWWQPVVLPRHPHWRSSPSSSRRLPSPPSHTICQGSPLGGFTQADRVRHAITVAVCKLCRQSSLNSVDFGKIPRGCQRRQARPRLDQPTTQHQDCHRFRGWNYPSQQ